jgi:hypothetical protein
MSFSQHLVHQKESLQTNHLSTQSVKKKIQSQNNPPRRKPKPMHFVGTGPGMTCPAPPNGLTLMLEQLNVTSKLFGQISQELHVSPLIFAVQLASSRSFPRPMASIQNSGML